MKKIGSPADFKAMVQAEHAVVFLFFKWSGRAEASRLIVEEWERKTASQSERKNFEFYQLAPDEHPFAWKWVNALSDSEEAHRNGSVVWLKKGIAVNSIADAGWAGIKNLE